MWPARELRERLTDESYPDKSTQPMMRTPNNNGESLCLVMSYSLWNTLQVRADFRPRMCKSKDFLLGIVDTETSPFFVAARSTSIRYPHTLNYAAFGRELRRAGCTHVVSSALCRTLDENATIPSLIVPDQFIDMHRTAGVDCFVGGEE